MPIITMTFPNFNEEIPTLIQQFLLGYDEQKKKVQYPKLCRQFDSPLLTIEVSIGLTEDHLAAERENSAKQDSETAKKTSEHVGSILQGIKASLEKPAKRCKSVAVNTANSKVSASTSRAKKTIKKKVAAVPKKAARSVSKKNAGRPKTSR